MRKKVCKDCGELKPLEEQKGCCAICGKHQSKLKSKLHVDHCHVTGKVRQLLCKTCNIKFE